MQAVSAQESLGSKELHREEEEREEARKLPPGKEPKRSSQGEREGTFEGD